MGATTIWERWDSMLPDGTINPGQMTSFNHYALGAVVTGCTGPSAASPTGAGYARVLVAPQPGGGISWARTSLETRQGPVSVSWQQGTGGDLDLQMPDSGLRHRGAQAARMDGTANSAADEHHLSVPS